MMRGVPALFFFVPFEHREVGDPKEFEALRVEKLVAVVILLSDEHPELPGGLQHRVFGQSAFWFAGPGCEDQQIIFGGIDSVPELRDLFREIPLQTFDVVVHSESTLLAEGFDFVALFAAQWARVGDMNRD